MSSLKIRALKRKVGQIAFHLDVALEELDIMTPLFKEAHPEHVVVLENIAQGIIMSEMLLRKFTELTWGHCPKVLSHWKH